MSKPAAPALLFGLLGTLCAAAQTTDAPSLYFRLTTPRGFQTIEPGRPVKVSSNAAIGLAVCVRARGVEDRFEPPDLLAANKGPEYFANRPPPNIVLTVHRMVSGGQQEVPFRVNSSGGGKDLAVYFVMVEIDILEERAIRQQRAEQFVDWMLTQSPGDLRSRTLLNSPAKQRLVDHFADQYINNPPGDYTITAKYTPSTEGNWKGTLVSGPAQIRVVPTGDSFDAMKAKLAATSQSPPAKR